MHSLSIAISEKVQENKYMLNVPSPNIYKLTLFKKKKIKNDEQRK